MATFYLILVGAYLYYCQSKYYPASLYKFSTAWSSWLATAFFGLGAAIFVSGYGWVAGLLLALVAGSLALVLMQLAAVLGKPYFYGLVAVVHGLAFIDLIY